MNIGREPRLVCIGGSRARMCWHFHGSVSSFALNSYRRFSRDYIAPEHVSHNLERWPGCLFSSCTVTVEQLSTATYFTLSPSFTCSIDRTLRLVLACALWAVKFNEKKNRLRLSEEPAALSFSSPECTCGQTLPPGNETNVTLKILQAINSEAQDETFPRLGCCFPRLRLRKCKSSESLLLHVVRWKEAPWSMLEVQVVIFFVTLFTLFFLLHSVLAMNELRK